MTYNQAIEKLGNREQCKIANNTYLVRWPAGAITVRLHATDILTFLTNGRIGLHTGGWRTATTKARLNEFSGLMICQRARNWFYGDTKVEVQDGDVFYPLTRQIRRISGKFENVGFAARF